MKNIIGRVFMVLGLLSMVVVLAGCPGGGGGGSATSVVGVIPDTNPNTPDQPGGGDNGNDQNPTGAMKLMSVNPDNIWVEGADVEFEIENLDMARLATVQIGFDHVSLASCQQTAATKVKCRTPEGLEIGTHNIVLVDGETQSQTPIVIRDSIPLIQLVGTQFDTDADITPALPANLPADHEILNMTLNHVFYKHVTGSGPRLRAKRTATGAELEAGVEYNATAGGGVIDGYPFYTEKSGFGYLVPLNMGGRVLIYNEDGSFNRDWFMPDTLPGRDGGVIDFNNVGGGSNNAIAVYNPVDDALWVFRRYRVLRGHASPINDGYRTIFGVYAWKLKGGVEQPLHIDSKGMEFFDNVPDMNTSHIYENTLNNGVTLEVALQPDGRIFAGRYMFNLDGSIDSSIQQTPGSSRILVRAMIGNWMSRDGVDVASVQIKFLQARPDGYFNLIYWSNTDLCAAVLRSNLDLSDRSMERQVCTPINTFDIRNGANGVDLDPDPNKIRLGNLRVEF